MKRVIVTGGSGFIGRGLTTALRARFGGECQVEALSSADVDLVDQAATAAWFRAARVRAPGVDHVIHLAAR